MLTTLTGAFKTALTQKNDCVKIHVVVACFDLNFLYREVRVWETSYDC
jgi:hypothetical protein